MLRHQNKKTLLERAADMMDLPADTVAGIPYMELIGNNKFYLSNHKGLLVYESDEIVVNCGKLIVRIRGDDLNIKVMNVSDLMVEGAVTSIEFEE